jgi:hypothetical protein
MRYSPILLFHICAGSVGVLSGFVAVLFRKGSRRHGIAGDIFVIAMMILSATGAYMAFMKSEPSNVLGGALTFYLVTTAWMTVTRADKTEKPSFFDWSALSVISTVAAVELTYGIEAAMSPTGLKYDYPPGPYFFMGSVAVLATVGDIRMLVRGGISGARRIARHLWRMCFALFVASASVFLARQQLFPILLQKTGVLIFLSVLPLILMIFWLVRTLSTKRVMGAKVPRWRVPASLTGPAREKDQPWQDNLPQLKPDAAEIRV